MGALPSFLLSSELAPSPKRALKCDAIQQRHGHGQSAHRALRHRKPTRNHATLLFVLLTELTLHTNTAWHDWLPFFTVTLCHRQSPQSTYYIHRQQLWRLCAVTQPASRPKWSLGFSRIVLVLSTKQLHSNIFPNWEWGIFPRECRAMMMVHIGSVSVEWKGNTTTMHSVNPLQLFCTIVLCSRDFAGICDCRVSGRKSAKICGELPSMYGLGNDSSVPNGTLERNGEDCEHVRSTGMLPGGDCLG